MLIEKKRAEGEVDYVQRDVNTGYARIAEWRDGTPVLKVSLMTK
jgi:hypothetical protein